MKSKKLWSLVFCAALIVTVATNAKPASKPIELKATVSFGLNNSINNSFKNLIKQINEKAKGELVVKLIGGPEAIPGMEQYEAVRSGVIDLNFTSSNYYMKKLPECEALALSKFEPSKERQVGFIKFLQELHREKMDVFFLGRGRININSFFLWSVNEIKDPRTDFKGLKFRTAGLYTPFYRALGIVPVTMGWPDVYTAVDTGMIQGLMIPPARIKADKYYEIIKYVMVPGVYQPTTVNLMNLNTFNRLPKHLQDLITDIQISSEPMWLEEQNKTQAEEFKEVVEHGVKPIKMSQEDTRWYVDTAYDSVWADLKKKASAENYQKLRDMLAK